MPYVDPSTSVILYKGMPMDNSYRHTVYFSSTSEQDTWFDSLSDKVSFTPLTFQRISKGSLKLQHNLSNHTINHLIDSGYNYMRFKNTRTVNGVTEAKWWYAFVTNIEYINEKTVEVFYEIDAMQSFISDITSSSRPACFVEREHSATDEIGDNLVPENLETGDYITGSISSVAESFNLKEFDYWILIAAKLTMTGSSSGPVWVIEDTEPNFINGCLVGCNLYNLATLIGGDYHYGLKFLLASLENEGKTGNLISIFGVPKTFANDFNSGTMGNAPSHFINVPDTIYSFEDYVPRNNKLFTQKYNFLRVYDLLGNTKDYAYEYFFENSPAFEIFGDISAGEFSACLIPRSYKNTAQNFEECINITNAYPTVAVATSTFKEWLGRNSLAIGMGTIASVLSIASGTAEGWALAGAGLTNFASMSMSAPENLNKTIKGSAGIGGILSTIQSHQKQPSAIHGQTGGNLYASKRIENLKFEQKQIRPEFAKIIDDYFSMYGYATHRVKKPNLKVRSRYTYVKTNGMDILGDIPDLYKSTINSVFDNGITFWQNSVSFSQIGQYTNSSGSWYSNSTL